MPFTVDCEIPESSSAISLLLMPLTIQLQHLALALAQLGIRRTIGQRLEHRRRRVAQSKVDIAYCASSQLVGRHAFERLVPGRPHSGRGRYPRRPCMS